METLSRMITSAVFGAYLISFSIDDNISFSIDDNFSIDSRRGETMIISHILSTNETLIYLFIFVRQALLRLGIYNVYLFVLRPYGYEH